MNVKGFSEKLINAYDEAMLKGNTKLLKELDDPKVVYHMMGMSGDIHGAEEHEKSILTGRMGVSDIKTEMKYLTGDSDLLVFSYKAKFVSNGKFPYFPPAGKEFSSDELFVYKIKGGKIIEAWSNGSMKGLNS